VDGEHWLNGSNKCCAVLLGVVMYGMKLPPFIVFKGTETRCILREFTVDRLGYLQGQFYSVQDKVWVNT